MAPLLNECVYSVYYNQRITQVSWFSNLYDLKKLELWEEKRLMEFSVKKCHVLRVTRKKNPVVHNYTLHGEVPETVDSAKYLGVTITSDLRWNRHFANITHKANQSLGFLRRNLKINSPSLKSVAYKSLVRPLLEYSSAAWGVLVAI